VPLQLFVSLTYLDEYICYKVVFLCRLLIQCDYIYEPEDRASIPSRDREFCVRHCIQSGSGAHPASCLVGTGGFFPGLKRPGREDDHSPPSSVEVTSVWRCTFTNPYVFMTCCLIKYQRHLYLYIINTFVSLSF
jgi:hypothetical protein